MIIRDKAADIAHHIVKHGQLSNILQLSRQIARQEVATLQAALAMTS
ncbi:hypothetical protein FHW89_001671 [Mucilaginibacter sp. SG564]|nr:hypothetical protein [Mucilaginibacter sp. SG564]